ncbi:hypothetical protein CC80DRAFT_595752 [Byssothecium circinans]|uniref:Uncharacterized protein n=1 Tax=Byssothecium circinans TaxID=147558 RepID=A0A6A5TNL9_9PLEO|nr:hypothetical protein CC80DRAFT_595752 [Byssothecium circinans]
MNDPPPPYTARSCCSRCGSSDLSRWTDIGNLASLANVAEGVARTTSRESAEAPRRTARAASGVARATSSAAPAVSRTLPSAVSEVPRPILNAASEVPRTTPNTASVATQTHSNVALPAPRTRSNPTPVAAREISPKEAHKTQLQRYLIELMGFTFDADFALLNAAMPTPTTTPSSTTSILSADERAKLLRLSLLLKELAPKFTRGSTRWLTVRRSERTTIIDVIRDPAEDLKICPAYVLKLISTYAKHQCDPNKRSQSSIERSKFPFHGFWTYFTFLGENCLPLWLLSEELWSHARIIDRATLDEEVRIVLANAFEVYKEEVLGISGSFGPQHTIEWAGFQWQDFERALR